ncbi:MAG TPA: hypothetical protein PLJ38_10305, partial [bacterium]|nr:hypothetical protein [bacterium]
EQRQVSTEEREKRMAEYQTQLKLDAQKQQLDEERKLEDERYKREQQIWNERQTSTEEREKRMAEYNLGLQTEAQTRAAINKLLIDTSVNLYNGIQSMIQRAQTDEAYRKELESNGMSIDKMREITIEKLIRNGIESFGIGQKLVDEILMRVNQENVYNAILKLTPQERLKLSKTLETEGKTITDIKNMNELYERLIKLQPPSTNISASVFAEKGIENQIKKTEELLSNPNLTKEQSTELQNILFKLRNDLEKPKSDKTQSGGTKAGKEQTNLQAQYDLIFKKYTQAIDEGKDEKEINYYKNILDKIEIEAAGKNIQIKKPEIPKKIEKLNTSNFKWEDRTLKKKLDSNPILKKYTESPELIPFEEIDKYIAIYQFELDRETNEGGVSLISRKNDTDIKQLSELIIYLKNRKQSESQQPTQNKGMQKLNLPIINNQKQTSPNWREVLKQKNKGKN